MALTCLAALASTGCDFTSAVLTRSWGKSSYPVSANYPKVRHPTFRNPVASKTEDGNLCVEYDRYVMRFGLIFPYHERIIVRREKKVVEQCELALAPDWPNDIAKTEYEKLLLPSEGKVPVREADVMQPGPEGFRPPQECVICRPMYVGSYLVCRLYWYVPPAKPGDPPRVALVARERDESPLYAYPLKLLSLPFAIALDMVLTPAEVCCILGGAPMP